MPATRTRGRPARPRGSVYWHAASERWCAQTPPDRRGRRRSRYFATEAAAWAWLDAQIDALDDGQDIAAGSEKLSAYLRRWLAREKANPDRDWSPSTQHTYTWAVERAADHRLARTPVGDLTRDHIDTMLSDLTDGLSRKSVGLIRSLLRSTLEDLADDGVLRRNPVRRARPVRQTDDTAAARCPWSEQDARRFLAEAHRSSSRPALWWLVVNCGLRSGELRALTIADLDLSAGTLTISKSLDDNHHQIGPTKSRRARTIDLPSNVVAALRDHLAQRTSLGGPLFQARPGYHMAGATLLQELRGMRQRAGVAVLTRVHDLRHVAASLMLANGYPVATVAQILGHASAAITLGVYAHAIPRHVVQAPRNMADVLPYALPVAPVAATAATDRQGTPAVRSAVPPPTTTAPRAPGSNAAQPRAFGLAHRYPHPLEVPARPDEQIEQPRAESAEDAG